MNIIRSGRVIDTLCTHLNALRYIAHMRVLPCQADPYRPSGVWALTTPGPTQPTIFSFPQPLHPLEALAALVGYGDGMLPLELGKRRFMGWRVATQDWADAIGIPVNSTRLIYHLLTPLVLPLGGPIVGLRAEANALWEACGFTEADRIRYPSGGFGVPMRAKFWTEECLGDIEL